MKPRYQDNEDNDDYKTKSDDLRNYSNTKLKKYDDNNESSKSLSKIIFF